MFVSHESSSVVRVRKNVSLYIWELKSHIFVVSWWNDIKWWLYLKMRKLPSCLCNVLLKRKHLCLLKLLIIFFFCMGIIFCKCSYTIDDDSCKAKTLAQHEFWLFYVFSTHFQNVICILGKMISGFIRYKMFILFNKTCLQEQLLPK